MKKYLTLITNPKKTIKKIIEKRAKEISKKTINEITSSHFLVPIDTHKSEDVFIVGYPKSGNTWMQSIVSCLKYGIDPEYLPESLAQDLVPDVHAKQYYKRYGQEMAFKSHLLPNEKYKRVIYIVRDGRDVMASYLGMFQNMGIKANIEKMIIEGEDLFPCKWHMHISAWAQNPFNANIEIIKYEDLLDNPIPELKKICDFIRINHSYQFLEKVADGNKFEKIKTRALRMGTAHKFFDQHAEGHKFFRKGKIGSHREELPKELVSYFEKEARKELSDLGYLNDENLE